MILRIIPICLLISSLAALAAPPAPVELKPVSVWHMRYADDSCKLSRDFGPEDNRVGIEFAQFEPGEKFQLALIGKPLKPLIDAGSYTLQFGALAEHKSDTAMSAEASGGLPVLLQSLPGLKPVDEKVIKAAFERSEPLPPNQTASEEAAVKTIRVASKSRVILLQTGSLGPAFVALRKCTDEVVRSWGIDPSAIKSPARPTGNPGNWITSMDYPSEALRENRDGLVNFRLSVDRSGKVTQCRVLRAINETPFAKVTCSLLTKRARFKSALDSAGNPVAGYFVSSVRFWVPK